MDILRWSAVRLSAVTSVNMPCTVMLGLGRSRSDTPAIIYRSLPSTLGFLLHSPPDTVPMT